MFAALVALAVGTTMPAAPASATVAGDVYAFGSNYFGQLGRATNSGTLNANPTPAPVELPGASGPVTEIAAGSQSLALTSSGQLYAWGRNNLGQLGSTPDETPNATPAPVALPGASGQVTRIAAGGGHTLVATSGGQLYAFGFNRYGQLGSTTNNETFNPTPTPSPVTLPGATGPVAQIAGGSGHSLALTSTGQLYAFGFNRYGQLGIATHTESNLPNPTPSLVSLPGASGPVTQIAAGSDHSLALTSTGQLYAFGENLYGQLGSAANSGTGAANPTPIPVTLPGAGGPVVQIAAGALHSLALTSTGQLYGFGENRYGQLGSATNSGTENPNPTPTLVTLPAAGGPVVQIAAGSHDSIAVTSTGEVFSFGQNLYGQLGTAVDSGTELSTLTPTPVELPAGTTIDAVALGSSAEHTLALIADLAVATRSLPGGRVGVPYRASVSAEGGAGPYSWQASGLPAGLAIGPDGQIDGVPTTAGTAQVRLSVRDRFGIAAQSPPLALNVAGRPRISRLRESHRRWREGRRPAKVSSLAARRPGRPPLGTTFAFRLNEGAKVRLAFVPIEKGRRHGRRGRAALGFAGHAGANRVAFQGRLSRHRRLKPGRYELTATATAGGARSKPKALRFTIVR